MPNKKKPAFQKPAAHKTSRKKPDVLIAKKPKNIPKTITVKPDTTFIDTEKLPALYNSTDVTLMVRDPYWIHAYWETTPASVLEVKKKLGVTAFKKSAYTLRVHDISATQSKGENARTSFDIDVDPKARNWYINLWRDNVTYYADFGVRTQKGAFYPLARSNTVTLPRAATAPGKPDAIWMRVKGKGECSIVNVAEIKPFTAALRPVPDADSGTEKALLQRLPKLPMDHEFAPSDSGLCKDMTGFFGSNQFEQTPASGGSSAYPW